MYRLFVDVVARNYQQVFEPRQVKAAAQRRHKFTNRNINFTTHARHIDMASKKEQAS